MLRCCCVSDNGGYSNAGSSLEDGEEGTSKIDRTNEPLRGDKNTIFEGGVRQIGMLCSPRPAQVRLVDVALVAESQVRVPGFIYSPRLPSAVRGATFDGLVHVTDWLPTLLSMATNCAWNESLSSLPVDGFDLWSTILNVSEDDRAWPRGEILLNADPDGYRSALIVEADSGTLFKFLEVEDRVDWFSGLSQLNTSQSANLWCEGRSPSLSPTATPQVPSMDCGPHHAYRLRTYAAQGDGWQGAMWSVNNSTGIVASGTLASGSEGSDWLCLADDCYELVVGGGSADSEIGFEFFDQVQEHQTDIPHSSTAHGMIDVTFLTMTLLRHDMFCQEGVRFQRFGVPSSDHLCVADGEVLGHLISSPTGTHSPTIPPMGTPTATPIPLLTAVPSVQPSVLPSSSSVFKTTVSPSVVPATVSALPTGSRKTREHVMAILVMSLFAIILLMALSCWVVALICKKKKGNKIPNSDCESKEGLPIEQI